LPRDPTPYVSALGVEIHDVSDPCGRDLIAASAGSRNGDGLGYLVYLIHDRLDSSRVDELSDQRCYSKFLLAGTGKLLSLPGQGPANLRLAVSGGAQPPSSFTTSKTRFLTVDHSRCISLHRSLLAVECHTMRHIQHAPSPPLLGKAGSRLPRSDGCQVVVSLELDIAIAMVGRYDALCYPSCSSFAQGSISNAESSGW